MSKEREDNELRQKRRKKRETKIMRIPREWLTKKKKLHYLIG